MWRRRRPGRRRSCGGWWVDVGDDNLLDVIRDLRGVVTDLKRVVYGDQVARIPGLLEAFDQQQRRIETLETDVKTLKNRRPMVWIWVLGYLSFIAAWALGAVAMTNRISHLNLLDLPFGFAAILASVLAIVALVLFVAGFGWMRP